jgi:hypothetical protein
MIAVMHAFATISAAVAAALLAGASAHAGDMRGAYVHLQTESDGDCARACEDDSLCMAWTLQDQTCGLRATAPDTPSANGGLSERARSAGLHLGVKSEGDFPAGEPTPNPPALTSNEPDAGALLLGGPLSASPDKPGREDQ